MDITDEMHVGSKTNDITLPLLIKKYDDGYFTSSLISNSFSGDLRVSCAKGNGLGLE